MTTFAITGGIGAGKSTVIRGLRCELYQLGYRVEFVSLDMLVTELYANPEWLKWLQNAYGTTDRSAISKLAFSDPNILQTLNAKSGFKIGVHLGKLIQESIDTDHHLIVEFPLLFESLMSSDFDHVVAITANDEVRAERVVQRGNKTLEQARLVISAQEPEAIKISQSDFVIDTSTDASDVSIKNLLQFIESKLCQV